MVGVHQEIVELLKAVADRMHKDKEAEVRLRVLAVLIRALSAHSTHSAQGRPIWRVPPTSSGKAMPTVLHGRYMRDTGPEGARGRPRHATQLMLRSRRPSMSTAGRPR